MGRHMAEWKNKDMREEHGCLELGLTAHTTSAPASALAALAPWMTAMSSSAEGAATLLEQAPGRRAGRPDGPEEVAAGAPLICSLSPAVKSVIRA